MSDLSNAIRDRHYLTGTLVSVASPPLAEALSRSGLDWLFFDLEHSVMSLADVQTMIQAMDPSCLSMIRLEEPLPVFVKRAMDTGCSGVIVPQVNSPELAEAMVSAAKYPPQGGRSVGLGRSLGYGATLAQGTVGENERTSVVVQIEHQDAVAAVREIAAVEGVEALFVGPYDLSGSFGVPGQVGDPRVQAAIEEVLRAAADAGKPAGIFVGNADAARKELARGFEFVAVGADISRLVAATRSMCEEVRSPAQLAAAKAPV
jgi:2-keto-3-deoxy-L-rhamnonate aldolase RhmA